MEKKYFPGFSMYDWYNRFFETTCGLKIWKQEYCLFDQKNHVPKTKFPSCGNWPIWHLVCISRCNVDRMKLLKKPLPLDGSMENVWLHINKIIDSLHINNHTVNINIHSVTYDLLFYLAWWVQDSLCSSKGQDTLSWGKLDDLRAVVLLDG